MPKGARLITWLLLFALAAYAAELVVDLVHGTAGEHFEKYVSNSVFLGCALLCGWRALAIRDERVA